MSAYPESWEIGDTRARNLVPRPKFPTTARGAWNLGSVASDAGAGLDGETANRLRRSGVENSAQLLYITLLDAYEPGLELEVTLRYKYADEVTIPLLAFVADRRHHVPHIDPELIHTLDGTDTYQTVTFTVTTPVDNFRTNLGDTFEPNSVHLCLYGRGTRTDISFARVDYPGSDIAGYFDGDTLDTAELAHDWTGDPLLSASTALALTAGGEAPDPEPDPDPEPEPGETTAIGRRVAAFLGQHGNEGLEQLATQHAAVIAAMAESYTRGRGFVDGEPAAPIAAVIVTATARLLGNPQQTARQIGDVSYRGGFAGWSLAELYVLNNYRKRQA